MTALRFVRVPATEADRAYDAIIDVIERLAPGDAVDVLERALEASRRAAEAYRRALG